MSLLDGYEEIEQKPKDNIVELPKEKHDSLLDGFVDDEQPTKVLEGGVSKDVRTYESRFPERNKNFFSNAGKDIKDTVVGLAGLVGNTANFLVGRPLIGLVKEHKFLTGKGREDLKNLKESLPALGEGLKENYGQGNLDMVNWQRIKEGKSPIQIDLPGLAQSFYAHPLNLLDIVGAGEVGKVSKLKNLTKGGELSNFSKNIGNKVIRPRYSENLVFNAGQRALETKPVQAVVNAIDKSPLRPSTDVVADFLGLSPESRLMGQKGAEVRQAKLLEQKYQTKNINERNKAIAENTEELSGLTDAEAKELVKNIESGGNEFIRPEEPKPIKTPESEQRLNEIKDLRAQNKTELSNALETINQQYQDELQKVSYINPKSEIDKRYKKLIRETKKEYNAIEKSLMSEAQSLKNNPLTNLKNSIMENQFTKKALQTIKGVNRKGRVWTEVLKNEDNAIIQAERDFNDIIKEISNNTNRLDDTTYINSLENRIQKIIDDSPYPNEADFAESFWDRYAKALDDGMKYNETKLGANKDTSLVGKITTQESPIQLSNEQLRVRNLLQDKVNKNAEFYIKQGLLDEQTVHDLPINNYASIKYNKPIDSLTDAEKLDALKDIEKMPKEQQPFYIPMMFDDKLRAGDFFANSTKKYKPGELKHRSVGMGLEENRTGGKRVYNPVELANRLDAHRIKMVNTENMINEIIDNFAKPYDMSKDKILDGYVPFNPDAFMKFYRKSIDLNELTIRKLDELQNIDTALKTSVQEAIKTLPEDVMELLGAFKNNKIYQIPEDVAKTLMQGKNAKGIWEMMFDMSTAGFKRKVLGLSPKWFINNRIGNGIMAGLKGVSLTDYAKALNISDNLLPEALRAKSMYEAEKTIIGRTGGSNNGFFGNTMRLLGGEFIDTSELKGMQKVQAQMANSLGIPGKVMNTITDAMFNFNQKFEDWERRAAYIHSTNTVGKKMMKSAGQNITKQNELLKYVADNEDVLSAVMKDVDNTLGDYINMTATERRAIRKIVPFYSWFRTITRYTLSLPESNPFRANIANKISMVLAEENEKRPEYQRAGVDTGYLADRTGKNLLLNYEHSIPFSTFGETADNPTGLLNPMLTQLFEVSRGRREFMDRPFTSRKYENVFPNGYASLDPKTLGEYSNELPILERLKALPIGYARTAIPGFDWLERVGIGGLQNYLQNGEFTPKDALFDTSLGGYNYNEGFSKKPKGWSNEEQLLKLLLPLQQEGKAKGRVRTKRQPTKSLYDVLTNN